MCVFAYTIVTINLGGVVMSGVYTISQLRDILSPIFGEYNIRKAILFGSYGKGTASPKSDVDLLVDSGLHGLRFVGFLGDVQNAVGKDVDLFDVTHIIPNTPIDREIQQTGVVLYEK